MKRILCVLLTLTIIFCIAFECSLQGSAVVGVDDAIIIATVCMDLAALGVTFNSVSNFVQSDTFNDFTKSISNNIDRGISCIKRNGKLYFATAKMLWADMCGWVKDKFNGLRGSKDVSYDVETPTRTITLADGTTCPYDTFMGNPFILWRASGTLHAYCCTGNDVTANFQRTVIYIYCFDRDGTAPVVEHYVLTSGAGSWAFENRYSMNYGTPYQNRTGYLFNLNFSSTSNMADMSKFLYRTIPRMVPGSQGNEIDNTVPVNSTPSAETTTTETVSATNNPEYNPGSVEAPAQVIEDGELMLIEVPSDLIVDAGTVNETITTDLPTIGNTLANVTSENVRPVVLTNTGSVSTAIDQIITDTPVAEMDASNAGSAESDIEIANKFRLPRSFLEGFPFSIPYSIYAGLQSFVADPQAPVFDFPFRIPGVVDDNVHIDLSDWNPVARLCRSLLSLVWLAGLALACHKFIKR